MISAPSSFSPLSPPFLDISNPVSSQLTSAHYSSCQDTPMKLKPGGNVKSSSVRFVENQEFFINSCTPPISVNVQHLNGKEEKKGRTSPSKLENERSKAEEFAKVAQRIETLTQVLHRMRKYGPPCMFEHDQIPDLLRHFAVLLTCGQKGDIDAKRVTAVTGRTTTDARSNTMLITQNPHDPRSPVSRLAVHEIIKPDKTFKEVISG